MTSPRQKDYSKMALQLFHEICSQFSLSYERDSKAPVEVCLIVPAQKGLSFEITLMLQNVDELWLCTDNFTMSLFPCWEEKEAATFKRNAISLLSGKARIVEYRYIGRELFQSVLETFDGKEWESTYLYGQGLGLSFVLAKLFPSRVAKNIIMNRPLP